MAESSTPRPPAQAAQPSDRSAPDGASAPDAAAEPRVEDLGARSFAGQNIAEDVSRQGRERGAGLGAGGSGNRDARTPAQGDGEVPEDDLD